MKQTLKIIPFSEYAAEFNPIRTTRQAVPQWYKASQNRNADTHLTEGGSSTSTYKQCSPFLDALTLGYIAVLTADIEITQKDNNLVVNNKSVRTLITDHSPNQWDGMAVPKGYTKGILKWQQDIVLKTPKGYSSLFTQPMNRFDLPFLTISGVVDTDNYPIPIHFPFWIREDFSGIIEMGTPVCQIIPFKREDWKTELKEYDEKKSFIGAEQWRSKIVRSYKNQWWNKKSYDN